MSTHDKLSGLVQWVLIIGLCRDSSEIPLPGIYILISLFAAKEFHN